MDHTTLSLDDIYIRNQLLPGDLGYIAYLHGQLYARECSYGLHFEAYVLEGLHEFAQGYDPSKDKVWICEHEEQIIGSLIAVNRGEMIQLRYFLFHPAFRGIGLGKKLMEEFMTYMKENAFSKAYLWTTNEQYAATSLYTRFGFRLTEEKVSDAFDKHLTERKYLLDLA